MFSQWFVHPWLLAGLGLVAAPVLIHLLHRLRFRRVRWGPMEFLLQSRRRRRRLMLEHLLLLLLRCAFTAIAVLIVARPETAGALEGLLAGSERTAHVVVLDDTMSMGQSRGSESAFDAAKAAVARAVGRWAERPGERTLTLLRTSAPTPPDVAGASVDEALSARMERLFAGLAPSYLARSPAEAVRCAERMLGESSAAKRRLHVFSDFQRKDWGPQSEIYAVLRRLGSKGASIQLIDASGDPPPNLAVVEASARVGTVAAGSAFRVEAVVRNFSSSNTGPTVASASLDGRPLPACAVGGLAAGESASASFDAASAAPGVHEIAFEIPVDGLAADNRRTLVVEAQQEAPVLIVDGGAERRDSLFLSLALAPGGGVDTGLAPRVRSVEALRQDDLSSYRAVYLVDVPEVDSAASARLLEYVQGGGGVGVFLGGGVDPARYNAELFRGGEGLLPAPLGGARTPSSPSAGGVADFQPEDHPVFRAFSGERNSFLQTISIRTFFEIDERSLAPESRVIARHRSGAPLAVERTLGKGRVVLFLTTAGDAWTSWPQNPTYVVAMLLLNDRLSESARHDAGAIVGEPWKVRFDPAAFQSSVVVDRPGETPGGRVQETLEAALEGGEAVATFENTLRPGVYRMQRIAWDGAVRQDARAYNVSTEESDLRKATLQELSRSLSGLAWEHRTVDQWSEPRDGRRRAWKDWLILLAALVLACESALALRLGFHQP